MTIKKQTLAEQLLALKPRVKAIPKVEVRRKKSWRSDSYAYEVEFVKPSWESLSSRDKVQFIDCFMKGV